VLMIKRAIVCRRGGTHTQADVQGSGGVAAAAHWPDK
jgi:hypothetical protein